PSARRRLRLSSDGRPTPFCRTHVRFRQIWREGGRTHSGTHIRGHTFGDTHSGTHIRGHTFGDGTPRALRFTMQIGPALLALAIALPLAPAFGPLPAPLGQAPVPGR